MSARNSRTLRTVDVFHEVNSDYAVSRARSEQIVAAGLTRLNNTLRGGVIEIGSISGLAIRNQDRVLDTARLRVPSDTAHSIILTRRSLMRDNRTVLGTASVAKKGPWIENSRIVVNAESMPQDVFGIVPVETLVHEGIHSLGIGHCALSSCLMNARKEFKSACVQSYVQQNPLCGDCTDDVEIAGNLALAQVL